MRIRNTAPAGDPDAIVHRLCDRFAIDLRIEGTEHATVASFSVQ
ncbi:hypothetical protein [Stenotrophomonas sp.]|nr:hypothetical protein [Stenotrophomonas sp.]MDX3936502.1 hypothetical protein [Stenotrophomonas sp.]